MIRRVNFYAGPGSGKSTLAPRVFAELSIRGYKVAQVDEWIKAWAILGIKPESFDQLTVFANQLSKEDMPLRKADLIVTDSPVLMNAAYSQNWNFVGTPELISLALKFEQDFPSLNFFIDRTVPYQSYEEAVAFDSFLLGFLAEHLSGELIHTTVDSLPEIVACIESRIPLSKGVG
jgi:hypothetical protein